MKYIGVLLTLPSLWALASQEAISDCKVIAATEYGRVCGVKQFTENQIEFASFLNVPYAKQPLGELRFAELKPPEPWEDLYDATKEGPICIQSCNYFDGLMRKDKISEACIHVNIFTPMSALPDMTQGVNERIRVPILVFIHGGGFVCGSGNTDLYGPEYFMDQGVILITFNYRLGPFGYLSLNSTKIPGNNGLRDTLTLLRWVKKNAKYFGGDPDNITLGGESAGGAMTHILTLSKAAEGLFHRAIIMSGVAVRSFYTASKENAKKVANSFLSVLRINDIDPEDIHTKLIQRSLEEISMAFNAVVAQFGLVSFSPVVETPVTDFTTILDADPEDLLYNGNGKNIPILVGYTDSEAIFFKPDLINIDIASIVKKYPEIGLSPDLVYKVSPAVAKESAEKADKRYFNGDPSVEKYIRFFTESAFIYPSLKVAEIRKAMGAPTYLYEIGYEADFDAVKFTKNITYKGTAHVEDLTFIFRTNILNGFPEFDLPTTRDRKMRQQLTTYFRNFIFCSNPTCDDSNTSLWPALSMDKPLMYQHIKEPGVMYMKELDEEKQEMVEYFKDLEKSIERVQI